MNDRKTLIEALQASPLVEASDELRRGHVRLRTPFKFPDGSKIDLFVHRDTEHGMPVLSDLGTTANWLSMLGITTPLADRRKAMLEGIVETCGVEQAADALRIVLDGSRKPVEALINLATACIRFADIMFTRKTQEFGDFKERVETSLLDSSFEYKAKPTLLARGGRSVEVDFLVKGKRMHSAVLTMAAKTQGAAKQIASKTFIKAFDLIERPEQRVVLFDDDNYVWVGEDIDRFAEVGAQTFAFSDSDQWKEYLAA